MESRGELSTSVERPSGCETHQGREVDEAGQRAGIRCYNHLPLPDISCLILQSTLLKSQLSVAVPGRLGAMRHHHDSSAFRLVQVSEDAKDLQ